MTQVTLAEHQWETILGFLRSHPHTYVGKETRCRQFLEGVLWITRSGAQWRLLPAEYGNWNSLFKRFGRWCERGVWSDLHEFCAADPNLDQVMIDSTVVRAHPCAAGAEKKRHGG